MSIGASANNICFEFSRNWNGTVIQDEVSIDPFSIMMEAIGTVHLFGMKELQVSRVSIHSANLPIE